MKYNIPLILVSFTLSDRTIDGILKNALGIKLEKLKAGHYRKIN